MYISGSPRRSTPPPSVSKSTLCWPLAAPQPGRERRERLHERIRLYISTVISRRRMSGASLTNTFNSSSVWLHEYFVLAFSGTAT